MADDAAADEAEDEPAEDDGDGDRDAAEREANEAIRLANRGIALRDEAGNLDAAEAVFKGLIAAYPAQPYGWQELGVLHARRGSLREAVDCFRAAVRIKGDDILFRVYCGTYLPFVGEAAEAEEVLAGHEPASDAERTQIEALRDAARFVGLWPQARALDLSRGIEEGGSYLGTQEVEAGVLQAARDGHGFSLIRIGDGEGAWLKLGPEDERTYPHIYAWNRKEFLRLWFNNEGLHDDPRFHALADGLSEAMDGATVLGMPYSLRVVHEYGLCSTRGVPSTVNALRWLGERVGSRPRAFCSQDVHIEMQLEGCFGRILRAGHPVGLISCHTGLPALVAERTGARVARFHAIPEEKGFSAILGFRHEAEQHFPTAFDRIVPALKEGSRRGEIWLVSAGFLGKLYCEAIRAGGGVALDIGSVADGWFGKVTRPTLQEIERFAL